MSLFRALTQSRARLAQPSRNFSTSLKRLADHYPEGPYSNLPFKVHNRRIPYAVPHFLYFALGFGIPFFACYVQLKRSGSL
ncbi:hypothetical protein CANARDRAFT_196010 [[Candida] arabinofermentans NRRL YB-2248]|uniref:Cytochrome c oxidase subunit 8, mitochondrial n=1 Tax=[Candida] arabinofermentans NRRL YB-2248 TaxID=983967 RepID=A0A1E4T4P6_9ASCO|nr:hypothetical protein CANARDRAFT_196010 [[Candida] arabinofermentans NRRL YB-2248]